MHALSLTAAQPRAVCLRRAPAAKPTLLRAAAPRTAHRVRAVPTSAAPEAAAPAAAAERLYEAQLDKPIGVKFARGNDGGAYVVSKPNDPRYDEFEVGDKIVEVWKAENYGQVMYAIKTRSGGVYLKMRAMNGDLSAFEKTDNTQFQKERNGGNYGSGTQELQRRNYIERKELEKKRTDMFNEAIGAFNKSDYEAALIVFENIVGLEPKNYIGDNFEKVTNLYRVAQYNIACCYSCLGAVEPGLEALQVAMSVGFDDFRKIRTDSSLKTLQQSDKFKALLNKYDEPFINEAAFKAFTNLFGGKK